MTWEISDRNSEHRLALKIWAKPATVHGHGWSGYGMTRRSYTNSWFATLCRWNLTSEWTISALLLPDLHCLTMSYQISLHLLEIFTLFVVWNTTFLPKNWSPSSSTRVKEISIQLGTTGKAIYPILRVYMSPMKATWVSKRFRTSLPVMPNFLFLTLLH